MSSRDGTPLPVSLLEFLANALILHQISPYLPVSARLNLAASSKDLRALVYGRTDCFRYTDLSTIQGAIALSFPPLDTGGEVWRSRRMDEALTEDEFYAGPLRGVFSFFKRRGVLHCIQTLILDGLSVTAELVNEIICSDWYNVRILSIRDVKNLNERKLMQVIKYAVRPTRPKNSPKLKALYCFGVKEKTTRTIPPSAMTSTVCGGVTMSVGAQLGMEWNERSQQALSSTLSTDPWYEASGTVISPNTKGRQATEWSEILRLCQGIIAFDGVLCRGPAHELPTDANPYIIAEHTSISTVLRPEIATNALGPNGCQICRTIPEGPARFGESPSHRLPLLAPPPLHSSSVSDAQRVTFEGVSSKTLPFFARCSTCLVNRWCEGCKKFWCEKCYQNPEAKRYSSTQSTETSEHTGVGSVPVNMGIKVHLGLCVEGCLVEEMYNGAGSGGMWG